MTATTARVQVHGLDRLVMKVSLSMLMWARRRAARASIAREEHTRIVDQAAEMQRRDHEATKRVSRVI